MFNILHSHYKIIRVLGLGKSGITYLAEDLDLINSPLYVIKEVQYVNNDGSIPRLLEQLFETQGSIAYRVGQHPQIPSLIAKFEENGNKYLVREYVDGQILSQLLTDNLSWNQTQVFDFLMDLMGILSFVHGCKYIHQDLNPDNIIRRSDDGRFNVIGFSSTLDLQNIDDYIASNHPGDLDNCSYIPYEQAQNMPQFNSDLYAVGAIAIQALTGKFPLDRDPDSYEFTWRNDVKLDHKLIKIIDRLVRPDYRNRYQSALEVLADLQSFASSQISSKSFQLKPHLVLGGAACTFLMGFGAMRLISASVNNPQVSSPPEALVNSSSTNPVNQVVWRKYIDRISGIKVNYPQTWHQEETHNILTGETVVFTSQKSIPVTNYRENISVRIENLTDPQTSLSNYTKLAIAEINKYDQTAKIIESSSMVLAKQPANLVIYTGHDQNSVPIKNLEVWMIDGGKVYILTYKAAPDRYYQSLETAMAMINSFRLPAKVNG